MSSIKLDLYRRDFTINTLAIQLNPDRFGMLIDFFSARRDIKEKIIRVLHNLSFVEDPTRVFRAIRFEQRFGFTIGKLTAGLIKNAVDMDFFRGLSGRRVFAELKQILEEENPVPTLVRLNDFDLLKVIHPTVKFDKHLKALLNSTKNVLSWHDLLFLDESYMKWVVYFSILINQCNRQRTAEICSCLYWLERNLPVSNSALYQRLIGFRTELILYMMAATRQQKVKKSISHFFTRLRRIDITIKGRDLKAMGLEPGPLFRDILQATLDAKLNGKVKTRVEELEFARGCIR
jgi:tRNA nucleotidyltransferase (CCA-adding enzyme)